MSQNLISLTLDDETLAGIDAALDSLEAAFIGLVALTPEQRRSLARMGDMRAAVAGGFLAASADHAASRWPESRKKRQLRRLGRQH